MNNQKQIATTHHYLAVGIKEQFEKEGVDNPGEVLKDGELELVYALYDYAVILTEAWNSLRHLKEGIGIFDYQISEVFAPKMFIAMSKKAEVINPELKGEFEMPCLIEWGQLCEKLITHWIKGTPGLSNGIEFMVYSNEKNDRAMLNVAKSLGYEGDALPRESMADAKEFATKVFKKCPE